MIGRPHHDQLIGSSRLVSLPQLERNPLKLTLQVFNLHQAVAVNSS